MSMNCTNEVTDGAIPERSRGGGVHGPLVLAGTDEIALPSEPLDRWYGAQRGAQHKEALGWQG